MVYLDHNATTAVDERVLEAMQPFLHHCYGNASSLHKMGRIARSAMDIAREQVAALVHVDPKQVIFTSGGTEANNLALQPMNKSPQYALSAIEHPSVTDTIHTLSSLVPQIIGVNSQGTLNKNALEDLKLPALSIVSIMLANNETGAVQAIAEVANQLQPQNLILHTDAVQAVGKIPVDFNQLGVQRLTVSSHKIYGPKGCGALIIEKNTVLKPLIIGGGQEQNLRSGTENIAAIVGFGKAAELALTELDARTKTLLNLRDYLEAQLVNIPNCTIFSHNAQRLPNTVQFSIKNTHGEMLLMQLDQKNIAVSSGSACAATHGAPSPVLIAMGVEASLAQGAIRISLGKDNRKTDIDTFIQTLLTLIN